MDRDPELDQVLCNALSLQEDYPDMYLSPNNQEKSPTTTGAHTEPLSGTEMQIPLKDPNILQDTLLELYSMLGIPNEAPVSRTMSRPIKQGKSGPSKGSQEELPLTSPHVNKLEGPFVEEELESSKKTKDEEDDRLPSTSGQKHRKRTLYNKQQTLFLQKQFDFNPYPDYVSRCCFAQVTRIPEPRIQVWFQNRRARYLTKPPKCQQTEDGRGVGGKPLFVRGGPS
ncbi:homeobox protein siamois-like [Pseudophryne corroboree]|uniref:homeobox protein siamois-like n=1 Tax=Pseudophryne corroboree TaxID=495146 RepID=UPI003081F0A8